MLIEKLYKKMNEQIMLEFYSANLYLSMSSWCDSKGLSGIDELINQDGCTC